MRAARPATVWGKGSPIGPTAAHARAAGRTRSHDRLSAGTGQSGRCFRAPPEGTWSRWVHRPGPGGGRAVRCGKEWPGCLAMGLTARPRPDGAWPRRSRVLGARTAVPLLVVPGRPILTPMTDAVHDSRTFQHAKVFGDRLPADSGTLCQLRDGMWFPAAEPGDKRKSCLVTQGGEGRSTRTPSGGHPATASARHNARCSPSAAPSLHHFAGKPPGGDRWGPCRSRIP